MVLTCGVMCGTRMCAWDCGAVVACHVARCDILKSDSINTIENRSD